MSVRVSEHLRFVDRNGEGIVYHSLHGRGMRVTAGVWRLLDRLRDGTELADIERQLGRDLKPILEPLEKRGHVALDGGHCASDAPLPARPPAAQVQSGALITKLRLFVIQSCNLGCSYCLVYKTSEKSLATPEKKMTWPVARQAVDEYLKIGKRFNWTEYPIAFYGGEPLLNWPVIQQTLHYLKECDVPLNKFVPSINTNATLLSDEIFAELIAHRVRISISLDGVRDVNDKFRLTLNGKSTFDTVVEKLSKFLPVGKLVSISATLNSDTSIAKLPALVDLVHKLAGARASPVTLWLNLPYVRDEHAYTFDDDTIANHVVQAIEYGSTRNVHISGDWAYPFRRLTHDEATIQHCSGIGSEMAVWTDGKLITCAGGTESYGSIYAMDDALASDLYRHFSSRTVGTVKGCDGCEIQGLCGGGCAVDAKEQTGDWYRHPEHCTLDRALFRSMVRSSLG